MLTEDGTTEKSLALLKNIKKKSEQDSSEVYAGFIPVEYILPSPKCFGTFVF